MNKMNHIWGAAEKDIYDGMWFTIAKSSPELNRIGLSIILNNISAAVFWRVQARIEGT